MLWRVIKVLGMLAILAGLAFVAYAFVGPWIWPDDFAPPAVEVTLPVDLNLAP